MSEHWRPVVNWEGFYEVSNKGRIRTVARHITVPRTGRSWWKPSQLRKPFRSSAVGYLSVNLRADGRTQMKRIHVAVLEAFIGPRPAGMVGCHNDGNRDNNMPSNLRWDTPAANITDLVRHGTHVQARKTHCKRGHEFTPDNTRIKSPEGWRQCRQCIRDATGVKNPYGPRPYVPCRRNSIAGPVA